MFFVLSVLISVMFFEVVPDGLTFSIKSSRTPENLPVDPSGSMDPQLGTTELKLIKHMIIDCHIFCLCLCAVNLSQTMVWQCFTEGHESVFQGNFATNNTYGWRDL